MFLADESVDRQIVGRLRKDGHEVHYVAELEPGILDEVVLFRELEKAFAVIVPGSIRIRRSAK